MLTNSGLVAFAKATVGCPYMKGVNGQVVTEALIQYKKTQYPKTYTPTYVAKCRTFIGKRAYDCTAISDVYCGVDFDQDGWFARATETGKLNYDPAKGAIQKIPEIVGLHVHKPGHMGIYIGNGLVVEARGIDYGVVITRIESRGWTHWAKNYRVIYEGEHIMLKLGDKGQDVYDYQVSIKKLGYDIGLFADMITGKPTGCDGSFGNTMVDATRKFQLDNKLPQTGVVDEATYGKLGVSLVNMVNVEATKRAQAEANATKLSIENTQLHGKISRAQTALA